MVAAAGAIAPRAFAQETKDAAKSDAVFDDEKKPADTAKTPATTKDATVSDRDTIGFSQQNAASQMNELEERMFRLSEALRGLEPENASRLRLALQFSREEQILDQMRETHKLLKEAQLSKAETEVKELIAKLQHLRNLLLAEDLDFQLKLARLRQMRETLAQLERIIVEEKRELGWSRFALAERKRLERSTSPPARPGGTRPRPAGRRSPTPRTRSKGRKSRPRTPWRRSASARRSSAAPPPAWRPTRCSQTFSPLTFAVQTPIWPTP